MPSYVLLFTKKEFEPQKKKIFKQDAQLISTARDFLLQVHYFCPCLQHTLLLPIHSACLLSSHQRPNPFFDIYISIETLRCFKYQPRKHVLHCNLNCVREIMHPKKVLCSAIISILFRIFFSELISQKAWRYLSSISKK